jgi:translocation and assembly module TamB
VDRGVIYLPDPELARKRFVDFSSVVRDTATTPSASPAANLFQSVLFDGVSITLGDEVWLRSPEANIKLGGSLNVQRRAKRTSVVTVNDDDDAPLVPVLDGELRAERGTFTLDLGRVVQREFQVEGGTITYFETAGLAAVLNISAIHTVRAASGADVRIRVRLTGPLDNPILTLESAESFAMSQSDMVSYLIFGQQNFELGTEGKSYVQLAAQTIFPSATTFTASQLRGVLGPITDFIQLRPGAADVSNVGTKGLGALGGSIEDAFWTSRLGGEKQLTQNVFVSVGMGICSLGQNQAQNEASYLYNLFEGLSGRFEYRLSRNSSVKLGKEPSASNCRGSGASASRVVAAPAQWGLSFFKTWRF